MSWIDNLLNRITMYSLMLYFLIMLVVASIVLAFLGYLPYSPWMMIVNVAALYGACKLFNELFSRLFRIPINWESSAITGLILALIVGPVTPWEDIWKLVIVGAIAMLSKFVLVYDRRHLFNPAAVAVTISVLALGIGASWWVGNVPTLPFVLIGGLLFLRKARWFHLTFSFLITYILIQTGLYLQAGIPGNDIPQYLFNIFTYSPILFFSFVMLTEPLTMPGGKRHRMVYGALIASLASLLPTILAISYGLELSLLIGNIVALVIQGNTRRFLTFRGQEQVAAHTSVFQFTPNKKLNFLPGQFLLWTLPHPHPDMRGHRRYFSIASAPTEDQIMIVTKFAEQSSTFKKNLRELPAGQTLMASTLDGDFVLPEDAKKPIVLIAGGVGIAPFRSMIKDMLDKQTHRSITLFYSNNTAEEICFTNLFDQAKSLGVKTVYTLTDAEHLPQNWTGRIGYIDTRMIQAEAVDYKSALFYISGPDPMVRAMKKTLRGMGIASRQIKTDYFPGYA